MRLLISCGGTGGHFYPGLSLARRLIADGSEAELLLSGKLVAEQTRIARSFDVPVTPLPFMPPLRPGMDGIRFCWGAFSGSIKACRRMRQFKPDGVLAMGSFASLPLVVAALLWRKPIFLHDGNARIGKSNRMGSRFARLLGTAFPAVNGDRCRCPVVTAGMPLRPELGQEVSREEAIQKLNELFQGTLVNNLPTLLVFGGSQGARTLNSIFPEACGLAQKNGCLPFQVIHLCGRNNAPAVDALYRNSNVPALAVDSCSQMEFCYSAADLVVSRSGGSTVAELMHFGRYGILVPYPYAMEKHQDDNALYPVSLGGAEMIQDKDFTIVKVQEVLNSFLADVDACREKGRRLKEFDIPDAAGNFLNQIRQSLQK